MLARFKLPLWILPLALAVLVAAVGWWGNGLLRATIEDNLKAQLTTTLNANVTALDIWATNQTHLVDAIVGDSTVNALAQKILQQQRPPQPGFQPPTELQQFSEELRSRLNRLGYGGADLVNTNFQIVANSQRPQFFGNQLVSDAHTNKFMELFDTGEPILITPFKPELLVQRRGGRGGRGGIFMPPPPDGRSNDFPRMDFPPPPMRSNLLSRFNNFPQPNGPRPRRGDLTLMQVAAPLRDSEHHIIGALALIIDPDREFSRILSVARVGTSGETYAFDQTGLMISHSRFDEQLKQLGLLTTTNANLDTTNITSALNLRLHDPGGDLTKGFHPNSETPTNILISLVSSAVDGETTVQLNPSRDYRGVPVVGASCWLPQFGFGVATQIDATEAFRPLRVLQLIFVLLILFLLLCSTGLFVVSNLTLQRQLNAAEMKLKQLGQYTLEEKIGEGGMGVVYRARHALLRRDTAVKLLASSTSDTEAVARFEREVQLTCELTHPNTIQVFDYGHTPNGIFYYAMEYLRGTNLHDLIARFGPQPESRVAYILSQVCDSLAEAHALGLIHRDIKPANIFLCRRGGMPDCVKVLDFGLVREFRKSAPEKINSKNEEFIEGTPWFMPPEVVRGDLPVDPRSDIYSLGALGYFLLTGCHIFEAESIAEIHDKQLNAVPVPPSRRTTQPISGEMDNLIMCCLEKDLSQRPQSAEDLHARIQTTPFATDWNHESRENWWKNFEAQPATGEKTAGSITPLPAVNIDLAERME